ncbi:uncharacterized protein LOC115219789 [Argonauta hians]
MADDNQSFFSGLRDLARKLDHIPNHQNAMSKANRKLQCLSYLKDTSQYLDNCTLEGGDLLASLKQSYASFCSINDLVSVVLEQQTAIYKQQESQLLQYGYVPYDKELKTKKMKMAAEKAQEEEEEVVKTPDDKLSNKDRTKENESPITPQLKDFGLSHFSRARFQKPHNNSYMSSLDSYAYTGNCVSTPAGFQHNGLFMSPGVLGKMPPLLTPVPNNESNLCPGSGYLPWVSSNKKRHGERQNRSGKARRSIRKKLEEDDIVSASGGGGDGGGNGSGKYLDDQYQPLNNSGVFFLPPTPQMSNNRRAATEDQEFDQLPKPPKLLTSTFQFHSSNGAAPTGPDRSIDVQMEPTTPVARWAQTPKRESGDRLPSPPASHRALREATSGDRKGYSATRSRSGMFQPTSSSSSSTTINKETPESPGMADIPEPPKLYHPRTRLRSALAAARRTQVFGNASSCGNSVDSGDAQISQPVSVGHSDSPCQ